jgi:hypothetical protein
VARRGRPKRGRMIDAEHAARLARSGLAHGVLTDPGFGYEPQRWDARAVAQVEEAAAEWLATWWTARTATPSLTSRVRVSDGLVHATFDNTLLTTAERVAVERGADGVGEADVEAARRRVEALVAAEGLEALLFLYWYVATYLNLATLRHYERVSAEAFTAGALGRPWSEYSLHEELRTLLDFGFAERTDGEVRMTESGAIALARLGEALGEAGLFETWRETLRALLWRTEDEGRLDGLLAKAAAWLGEVGLAAEAVRREGVGAGAAAAWFLMAAPEAGRRLAAAAAASPADRYRAAALVAVEGIEGLLPRAVARPFPSPAALTEALKGAGFPTTRAEEAVVPVTLEGQAAAEAVLLRRLAVLLPEREVLPAGAYRALASECLRRMPDEPVELRLALLLLEGRR